MIWKLLKSWKKFEFLLEVTFQFSSPTINHFIFFSFHGAVITESSKLHFKRSFPNNLRKSYLTAQLLRHTENRVYLRIIVTWWNCSKDCSKFDELRVDRTDTLHWLSLLCEGWERCFFFWTVRFFPEKWRPIPNNQRRKWVIRWIVLQLFSLLNIHFLEPDTPTVHILTDRTTTNSFSLSWDPPQNPNGIIKSYDVYIRFREFSYYNPSHCDDSFQKEFEEKVFVEAGNSYVFQNAFPYASYYVLVQAVNGEETSGYSSTEISETLPGEKFDIFINWWELKSTWKLPCSSVRSSDKPG